MLHRHTHGGCRTRRMQHRYTPTRQKHCRQSWTFLWLSVCAEPEPLLRRKPTVRCVWAPLLATDPCPCTASGAALGPMVANPMRCAYWSLTFPYARSMGLGLDLVGARTRFGSRPDAAPPPPRGSRGEHQTWCASGAYTGVVPQAAISQATASSWEPKNVHDRRVRLFFFVLVPYPLQCSLVGRPVICHPSAYCCTGCM